MLRGVKIIHSKPCNKMQGHIMMYTEDTLGYSQNFCMVFKLDDVSKFGVGVFDRFGLEDQIRVLKQTVYRNMSNNQSWKVKFVKFEITYDPIGGEKYTIKNLTRKSEEIEADEISQLTMDDLQGSDISIHNIEYYEDYKINLFLRYFNRHNVF